MVPVNLAEHHVAGKDHHLASGATLLTDRDAVTRFINTKTAEYSLAIEMATVRETGMQAVTRQVVHLVDINRASDEALENLACCVFWGSV